MRGATYILLAIFTYLIEAIVLPAILYNRWQPDLILVWVLLISLLRGQKVGIYIAVIGGIIHDVIISNFFGLHFFPYLTLAYGAALLGRDRYEITKTLAFFTVIIGTILDGLFKFSLLWFAKADIYLWKFVGNFILPNIVWHFMFAFVVYFILRSLDEEDEYIW